MKCESKTPGCWVCNFALWFFAFLKKFKRSVVLWVEKKRLMKYVAGGVCGYKFTVDDLNLYLRERNAELQGMSVYKYDSMFSEVVVGGRKIFWPAAVNASDLPWLYHEIFDEFDINPSSYGHPKIDYFNAEWVVDAGCCEGFFSLFVSEVNCNCKLIAMEPLQDLASALRLTFAEGVGRNRIIVDQRALGRDVGVNLFAFDAKHLCESAFLSAAPAKDLLMQNYSVGVVSLDALSQEYDLCGGGVIKMDIEGAEMDALEGGRQVLAKYKPSLAIAVYHNYDNALKCRDIIVSANPDYKIEFRGLYGYFSPPRPYMLFAW